MKMTWKKQSTNKNNKRRPISQYPNLPFDKDDDNDDQHQPHSTNHTPSTLEVSDLDENTKLAKAFQEQGDKLAEDGRFREALGKWEAALTLLPELAVLHEQKAQVLLELGEAWSSLKAATRATELEPTWAEAWITLGRAQLNFGEPDDAIESFDRALAIKPDSTEAREDRQTAALLVKRRKLLHSTGLNPNQNRFAVHDKAEAS